MIPIVSFIGLKKSGKTTVARNVVAFLKEKGYRVGVVKSTHHTGIDFDRKESDTGLFTGAGADTVALLAPDQMVTFARRPDMKLANIVDRFFHDIDVIIGEGFKNERHINKIEVCGSAGELLKDQVNGVVALVTEDAHDNETQTFTPDQTEEIGRFIIEQIIEQERENDMDAILFVNGKKVPMKGFVQDALAKTVFGFVSTLKKTDEPETLELRIHVNNKNNRT